MLKLYGFAPSNYYNCVKTVLLEKDLPHEDVMQLPSQEPEVLQGSPMGKVPYIETEQGFLSETNVIYDYLEETQPTPALYPEDPFERARTRELVRIVELYLDAPVRRLLGTAIFGEPLNQAAYDEVRPALEKGFAAFESRAKLSPYAMGDTFTYADITSFFMFGLVNFHTRAIYDWDITETHSAIGKYLEFLGQRDTIASVQATMEKAFAEFLESLNSSDQ